MISKVYAGEVKYQMSDVLLQIVRKNTSGGALGRF